jgi:MoxR-like ATPase
MASTASQPEPIQHVDAGEFAAVFARIRRELQRVVVGQRQPIDQLLAAIFGGGHCLLTGMPGLGRTLIAKSLATILGLDFRRVQFTPDLLPSDLTGIEVLQENKATGARTFRFHKGPVFANLLLADELNRSPARTQSALLEVMQERQVTMGGATYVLPKPFILVATENSIEVEGIWPLGEAQVDRFMLSIPLEYPSEVEEERILLATTGLDNTTVKRAADPQLVLAMQALAREVPVIPSAREFALALVRMSRPGEPDALPIVSAHVRLGASPRAAQALLAGGQVLALARGRRHVTRQDVADLAGPVLRHRVLLDMRAKARGVRFETLLSKMLEAAWGRHLPRLERWTRALLIRV